MSEDESAGRPGHRPLLPEIAKVPDLPATQEVPQEITTRLAETRLHVADASRPGLDELLRGPRRPKTDGN